MEARGRGWTAGGVLVWLLVAVCACSARGSAASGRALDFTLVNRTGTTIHAIYVSPHDSVNWEENVIGSDTLPSGESVAIRFSPEERPSLWDLRVENRNGYQAEWKKLDLRRISRITLRLGPGKNVLTAEAE